MTDDELDAFRTIAFHNEQALASPGDEASCPA